jgi:hypothetical protein
MARRGTSGSARLRWYRFTSHPEHWEPERERRFYRDLALALRAAGALAQPIELSWSSGPRGGVALAVAHEVGASWMREALRPLYAPGQWQREVPPRSGTLTMWIGRRSGELGAPMLPAIAESGLAGALLRGLRSAPAGGQLRLKAWPVGLPSRPPALLERPMEPSTGSPAERVAPADDPERRLRNRVEDRRQEPRWLVALTVGAAPGGAGTAGEVARLVPALLRYPGGAAVRFVRASAWRGAADRPGLELSESELAAVWPFPWCEGGDGFGGLTWRGGIAVGWGDAGSVARVPVPLLEGRHLLLLGETGAGKSSTLLRLARAALEQGALVLLDPVGDTADRFERLLPAARRARIRRVGPTIEGAGINALADSIGGASAEDPSRARSVGMLLEALRVVRLARFPEASFWGPRIEEHAEAALRAASASPGATLVEAHRLLEDGRGGFEGWGTAGRRAVAEFDQWRRSRREDGEGARRLLGEVTRSPVLRRLLCAASPDWSLSEFAAPGSITVLRGDAAVAGEPAARVLLGVYLALLWSRILARPGAAKTFVLLDEIQWFAHEALADILRLGRRFNVHLYAATHSLASLPESLQEPLRTNVADFLLFRGDPREAREWSRWVPGISEERLQALPRGHGLLLLGKGSQLCWVRGVPPVEPARPKDGSPGNDSPPKHGSGGGPPGEGGAFPTLSPVHFDAQGRSDASWESLLEPGEVGLELLPLEALRHQLGWNQDQIRALGARLRREGRLVGSRGSAARRSWVLTPAPGPKGTDVSSEDPSRLLR